MHAADMQNCCEVVAVRHGLTDYNAQRRLQVGREKVYYNSYFNIT